MLLSGPGTRSVLRLTIGIKLQRLLPQQCFTVLHNSPYSYAPLPLIGQKPDVFFHHLCFGRIYFSHIKFQRSRLWIIVMKHILPPLKKTAGNYDL